MNQALTENLYRERTRTAFLWSRILKTPLWAIYGMLPFILYKDLGASPLQITLMVALKPAVAILSLYWSAWVNQRSDRLVPNIVLATILGALPFFFFPFVNTPWFFIFAFAFYMMLHRGVIPAWMELMKINLESTERKRVFSYGSTIGYLGDGIIPFLLGPILDGYFQSWRWMFPIAAFLSLCSLYVQWRIVVRSTEKAATPKDARVPFREKCVQPWKEVWRLMVNRPDFRRFQMGFMLGGSGLMVMHSVLPAFFMGVLELSYTELAIALTLCKGIGFALTSPIWARWMQRMDLYRFSGTVTFIALLFPLGLILAQLHLAYLYLAYIAYGVMQAGSELSWNLSGPIFSSKEDSSLFSSVNVVLVGVRGCFAPSLGGLMFLWIDSIGVLFVGALLCFLATIWMFSCRQEVVEVSAS